MKIETKEYRELYYKNKYIGPVECEIETDYEKETNSHSEILKLTFDDLRGFRAKLISGIVQSVNWHIN